MLSSFQPFVLLIVLTFTGLMMNEPIARAGSKDVTIHPPAKSIPILHGNKIGDIRFSCQNKTPGRCNISDFMDYAQVCALLVIKSGEIRLLRFNTKKYLNSKYELCHDPDEGVVSNSSTKLYGIASVTKSIASTLVGAAIAKRFDATSAIQFESILRRPIDVFLPALSTSAYAGVPLEKVLGMRSGVRWSEYGWHVLFADSKRFARLVRKRVVSVVDFARGYQSRDLSAARFNYSALDAGVVAAVAESMLRGTKLTDFLESGIWASMGAEREAYWGVDKVGTAIGPCCFRLTIRDLARFGMLVLNKGRSPDGHEVIPRGWFDVTTHRRPSSGDDIPEGNPSFNKNCPLGYRDFWWTRRNRTDFMAVGISGQFVHVYPAENTVIVQISDWGPWKNGDYLECETLRAHDALVAAAKQ